MTAETIGQRLRRLRLAASLSQRELSTPGVSYAYISRIEAEARTPSVTAIRKLADRLGVSAEYLETGNDVVRWKLGRGKGAVDVVLHSTDAKLVALVEDSMSSNGIAFKRA